MKFTTNMPNIMPHISFTAPVKDYAVMKIVNFQIPRKPCNKEECVEVTNCTYPYS